MAAIAPNLIAQYAYNAGLRGNAITIAVAISLAESGGNTTATHLNSNGTTDYGLWQINSVHSQFSTRLLLTPDYNAMAMAQISGKGSNWTAWTTYKSGAYKQYLAVAQNASNVLAGGAGRGSIPPPSTTPAMTVDQVFSTKKLWKWYSSRVTNPFNGGTERGEDFSNTWGTPIGIVMGGTVVRSVHNNNSIGDVVEIQTGDGSVWLYQHIRTKVRPGQQVSTGDIVGTEDGLPVDQYSTGPHIEVRYCPPGKWSKNLNSWVEPWINPAGIFSRAGSLPATGPGTSLTPVDGQAGPGTITSTVAPARTFTPLLEQVHETLINTPGFYGIALAVDEAEQFPGWIDLTQQTDVQILGADIPLPDITGTVRSAGASISDNFLPFAIRSGITLFGVVLFILLFAKAIAGPVEKILPALLQGGA